MEGDSESVPTINFNGAIYNPNNRVHFGSPPPESVLYTMNIVGKHSKGCANMGCD